MNSTNVILRFETLLGSIRTTHFSTVGLRDEIEKLKVQLKGTLPPPPAPDPKPTAKAAPEKQKVKCSKCSGKGTVKADVPCSTCSGSGYLSK